VGVPTRKELADEVDQIYSDHYDAIYRYVILSGSPVADADEIVQETFLRLLRFLATGRRIEKPRNWLLRVCHNVRLDNQRRDDRIPPATMEEVEGYSRHRPDTKPNPELALIAQERIEYVRDAMAQLSARQCEFLLLRAEGMKLREIAETYGITVQSVAESCARAIAKLGTLIHD